MSDYKLKAEPLDYRVLLDFQDRLASLETTVKQLEDTLTYVLNQIRADLEQRRRIRDLEHDTLTKLNKYLDNWL